MRRPDLVFVGLLLTLVLAACGESELRTTDAFLKEEKSPPKVRPDGRLTNDPPLLTPADVARHRRNSAQRAVMQLWYLAQAGQPDVVSLYEPEAQRSVGLSNLIGAYSLARPDISAASPKIVQEVRGEKASTVDVLAFTKGGPPLKDTFVLRRRGSKWLVAYDSLLARWLMAYVQRARDLGRTPSTAGKVAGERAVKAYRDGFVRTLQPRSRRAFSRGLETETPSGAPAGSARGAAGGAPAGARGTADESTSEEAQPSGSGR